MHPQLLDLSAERSIAIRDRGVIYQFKLQPITAERWLKYFDGIVSTSETRGREQKNVLDTSSAMLQMVGDALISASGYKGAGGADPMQVEGWRTLIPMPHRLAVGGVLASASVREAPEDDAEGITLGAEAVVLEALWNADENGAMCQHSPLVHNFKSPTFEHERRYMRDSSRSLVVGGSRTGKTVWTGVQRTLIALYDELIQSVEGYSWGTDPLGAAPSKIAQYMDAYHKVVAARRLFSREVATGEEATSN